jgi:hypothetical protein
VSYRRSKVIREADRMSASRCPPPCGKVRYATRKIAKAEARRLLGITGHRLRVYSGDDDNALPSCTGWFHLQSWGPAGRVAYYRDKQYQDRVNRGIIAPEQDYSEPYIPGQEPRQEHRDAS